MQSQNGWPAPARTRKWLVPGTGRHLVLVDGPGGFVLVHLALWHHQEVERLDGGVWDEWGYAFRAVRGSAELSNHASGTAMDLNATRHPLGVRGTYTARQAAAIRRRLANRYHGCIRWGGDYTGRADEMHYELNVTPGRAHRLALALADTPRGRAILAANPGARETLGLPERRRRLVRR